MCGEAVDMTSFVIKAVVMGGGNEFSKPMLRGFNALRCTVTNFGENFWNLVGAIYWISVYFKKNDEMVEAIAEYYPYQCTCMEEIEFLQDKLGAKADTMKIFKGCSEAIINRKAKEEAAEKDDYIPDTSYAAEE